MVLKIVLLSPYHTGSHQAWAEGYQKHSQHEVVLLTLPGRFWKWRMVGGAITLAEQFLAQKLRPEIIMVDDMVDLPTFLALTRKETAGIPVVLYMHENQLNYPTPTNPKSKPRQWDELRRPYVWRNYRSMLTADVIWFNSEHHRLSWFAELPTFLRHYPDYQEEHLIEKVQAKSQVMPVGLDLNRLKADMRPTRPDLNRPPLIVWNQRWEFDKNPQTFLEALYYIKEEGLPFEVALCGETFSSSEPLLAAAQEKLGSAIVHIGYANFDTYQKLLHRAEITISTAYHEFFGISILEAIACHTFPLLPHRLSYPELIPAAYHPFCLYKGRHGLLNQLKWALSHRLEAYDVAQKLAQTVDQFNWPHLAPNYDQWLQKIVSPHPYPSTTNSDIVPLDK